MSKTRIEGSFVATVTPFDRRGEIDFGAWQALLDHQQRHGTRAILFMGSTGEPSLLSPEEKKRIIVETVKMRTGGMASPAARRSPRTRVMSLASMATSVRSEEHTSELQSLMRTSYAVF